MQAFKSLNSIIAHLELDNIDTDMIIPKQFLKTIQKTGLGKNLFHEMRYDSNEKINPDFLLNQEPFNKAKILLAGRNFGCGSSREHAPWSIVDFGIRVIIAESYADIFYNNCFKNSILPIKLTASEINEIKQILSTNPLTKFSINLAQQKITTQNLEINFQLDRFKKECLEKGLDDIDLTSQHLASISKFEEQRKNSNPWM
jgi:3-isopropylmalate/(R)-2-methylmalate dehydratase small subunit